MVDAEIEKKSIEKKEEKLLKSRRRNISKMTKEEIEWIVVMHEKNK